MQICLLKSKVHRATVTEAHVDYEGSMTIDADFMDRVGMYPYEKVLVGNLSNGNRFETYAIPGERGKGAIILNGATAYLGKPNDLLTIMTYSMIEEGLAKKWQPKVIVLGENNAVINERGI